MIMRNTILAIAAISVLTSLALSQNSSPLPRTTIMGAGFARGTQDSIGKVHEGASAATHSSARRRRACTTPETMTPPSPITMVTF
jgi:hypothetical protein